jgi:hypothetical protein
VHTSAAVNNGGASLSRTMPINNVGAAFNNRSSNVAGVNGGVGAGRRTTTTSTVNRVAGSNAALYQRGRPGSGRRSGNGNAAGGLAHTQPVGLVLTGAARPRQRVLSSAAAAALGSGKPPPHPSSTTISHSISSEVSLVRLCDVSVCPVCVLVCAASVF